MTERPDLLQRRLTAINEIGEVVGALRAMASGNAAAARGTLAALAAYEAQVRAALVRLAAPVAGSHPSGPGLVLLIGAAQGFCGAYPLRLAEAARDLVPAGAGLLVVGQRTVALLAEGGITPRFTADLPATPADIPALASRITDAIVTLTAAHPGPIATLSGRDEPGLPIALHPIWPPAGSDRPPRDIVPPLTTLPAPDLARLLLMELLFAAIARALSEGLRVENLARIEAMARAEAHIKDRRLAVEQRQRQARQEAMTTELIELAAGRQRGSV